MCVLCVCIKNDYLQSEKLQKNNQEYRKKEIKRKIGKIGENVNSIRQEKRKKNEIFKK